MSIVLRYPIVALVSFLINQFQREDAAHWLASRTK